MIALPPWMMLTEPDPLPLHRQPVRVREIVAALRAAGLGCDYAGTSYTDEVYLVSQDDHLGRLVVDRSRDYLDLWPTPADPNGMPLSWGHYDRETSGAAAALDVAQRAWPSAATPSDPDR